MQQNQEPSKDIMSSASYQSVGSQLTALCQGLPVGTAAFEAAQNSFKLFNKLMGTFKSTEKNKALLKDLEKQILICLVNIKKYLEVQKDDRFFALKSILENLEMQFQYPRVGDLDTTTLSTGSQYLHSMGFDQIVNMINAAYVQEPEWMTRKGTLLVLDSNPNTSQALMRRLTREGHTVFNAEDEVQAFECLRTQEIETILVDYQSFKDGIYEFFKGIENDPNIGYIPIILIGAPENAQVMEQILESGIGDYVAKPVNPVLLKMRVHAVLEKKYAYELRVKRSQDILRTRKELEAAIQDLPYGFAVFDQDNHMVMHNDKLFEFYPHLTNRNEIIRGGLTFEKFLETNVAAGIYLFQDNKAETSRHWLEEKEASFLLPSSQWEEMLACGLILGVTTYRTPDGGGALVVKDISKDKAQEKDLTFLAYHDSLTGLPNRKSFHQKLTQSIHNATMAKKHLLALLFLDLDRFKDVNDTHGHEMGDWLLNQVGLRLRRCIRGDDTLARFGGDEFCIILNQAQSRSKVKMVATRILKSISAPYIRNDISMSVGVSIGIGLYSLGDHDSESLLKEADAAMYAVKQTGKGQFRFYDETQKEKRSRKPKPTKSPENWQQDGSGPNEIA
ncbi:MAG: diguanylate cyclase [Alphaproteobacteria bacterium]|jgi:diguanylate cyclase (GGDEF)-like protein|nr:diguanylate cyclase [Alphaproteobacteria bacterium]